MLLVNLPYVVALGFGLSVVILLWSIKSKKYIGAFDIGIVFYYFHVFYRPLFFNYCYDFIDKDLYYWDEQAYVYGVLSSVILINIFQIGYLLGRRKISNFNSMHEVSLLYKKYLQKSIPIYIFFVFLYFYVFLSGSFNLEGGSESVRVPGFQYVWPLIVTSMFFAILFSGILAYLTREKRYIFLFVTMLLLGLVFGRRGYLIGPIICLLFLISYHRGCILGKKNIISIDLKLLAIMLFFLLVIFGGKGGWNGVVSLLSGVTFGRNSLVCNVITRGHQEFDLLWPAIIHNYDALNFTKIPGALIGNFLPHNLRLLHFEEFYSATDRLMMLYNRDTYLNDKFGISPDFYQFYVYYFGVFSLPIVLLLGYLSRYIESRLYPLFSNGKPFLMLGFSTMGGLLIGPFDMTLKYTLANVAAIFIFAFLVKLRWTRIAQKSSFK